MGAIYGAIINEVKQRVVMFNSKFTFEGQAANTEADSLAKFLINGEHRWSFLVLLVVSSCGRPVDVR